MRVLNYLINVLIITSCYKQETFLLETIIFPDFAGKLNIYGGYYSSGEELYIEAFPNEYFEFVGWSGSISSNESSISIIMNENKKIYAEFKMKDSDGDGINDDIDQCNDTPYGLIVNNVGCTSLQADYDNDGVINENDNCPNTPPNTSVSQSGCSLIYLDQNGVTLKAIDEARDSIGEKVLYKGSKVVIIKDWDHLLSFSPSHYKGDEIFVTTFLNELWFLCGTPCTISDKFDMSSWDLSNVKSMNYTFWNTDSFNQDISNWDVSKVEDMEGLFFYSYKIDVDISKWDVSNVTNMKMMFKNAFFSKPDLSLWDVSKVVEMQEMFYNSDISSDLKKWDVKSVSNMEKMFYNSKYFNHDLSVWETGNVNNCKEFYFGADSWTLPKPNFINCDPN